MRVGLNNFLRFISANGLSKVNQVLEALQDYLPGRDYYKDFREEAVLALVTGKTDRLQKLIDNLADERKKPHYEMCLAGFQQWLAKTQYRVVSHPKPRSWKAGEIQIAVNPEILIEVGNTLYIVKLYLSKEKLSQPARRAYAWLVGETHGKEPTAALLDVRKSRLTPVPAPTDRIEQWIRGEVAAFIALWKMNKAA